MQLPQSARTGKNTTSTPRACSARLSSRRSWAGGEDAPDAAQCASSLITKPATPQAKPQIKPDQTPRPDQTLQKVHPPQQSVVEHSVGDTDDAKRKSLIQLWYQRLLHFRANPYSLEFSYLVLANPRATKYHPYDLTIVNHDQLDTTFFYTMSTGAHMSFANSTQRFYCCQIITCKLSTCADGVTQTNGKEVTHMSLDEFERGYAHSSKCCLGSKETCTAL